VIRTLVEKVAVLKSGVFERIGELESIALERPEPSVAILEGGIMTGVESLRSNDILESKSAKMCDSNEEAVPSKYILTES
jgi:hypothetical protein